MRPRRRFEDRIMMDVREIGFDYWKCVELTQDCVQ
jgi:hypothetical protein